MGLLRSVYLPRWDEIIATTKHPLASMTDRCIEIPERGEPMSTRTNIPERLENAYLILDEHLDQHAPLEQGKWQDFRVQGVAATALGGYKVNFLWNAIDTHVPQCRTVCEIGLNAGHSSVLWMESCPHANAVLFDMPYKDWSQPTFDFLRKEYAGRVTITEGNSLETVPEYHVILLLLMDRKIQVSVIKTF